MASVQGHGILSAATQNNTMGEAIHVPAKYPGFSGIEANLQDPGLHADFPGNQANLLGFRI